MRDIAVKYNNLTNVIILKQKFNYLFQTLRTKQPLLLYISLHLHFTFISLYIVYLAMQKIQLQDRERLSLFASQKWSLLAPGAILFSLMLLRGTELTYTSITLNQNKGKMYHDAEYVKFHSGVQKSRKYSLKQIQVLPRKTEPKF